MYVIFLIKSKMLPEQCRSAQGVKKRKQKQNQLQQMKLKMKVILLAAFLDIASM